MSDFGLLPGIRNFESHVRLDLLKPGQKLTAINDGYCVTAGKVYDVVTVDGNLHVTNDDPKSTYIKTQHVKYWRHALGPTPHFEWDNIVVGDSD